MTFTASVGQIMNKPLDYFFRLLVALATFAALYIGIGILLKTFLPDLPFSNEIAIGVSLITAFVVILARPYLKVGIPLILIGVIAASTPTLLKALETNLQATDTKEAPAATKPEVKSDEVKQTVEEPKKSYSQ